MSRPPSQPLPASPRQTRAAKALAGLLHRAGRSLRAPLGSQCELCRRAGHARLCSDCVARFAAPRPRCLHCALPLAQAQPACGGCLGAPPPFVRTVCAVDYGFPWDQLIADFKFRGQVELAAPLAERLTDALRAAGGEAPDAVLPVPLSAGRLAERGYNQAWELARRVAAAQGLAARADVLQRLPETAHQAALGRAERQRNLKAAFYVDPARMAGLRGARLALVDDVMTTGATVREATLTLLRAGAAGVEVWALARTPAPADAAAAAPPG